MFFGAGLRESLINGYRKRFLQVLKSWGVVLTFSHFCANIHNIIFCGMSDKHSVRFARRSDYFNVFVVNVFVGFEVLYVSQICQKNF